MDHNAGVVHLSSSNGTSIEIHEDKLSTEDLNYVRSLDMQKRAQRRVITSTCYPPFFAELVCGRGTLSVYSSPSYAPHPHSLLPPPLAMRSNWNRGRQTLSLSFESMGLV